MRQASRYSIGGRPTVRVKRSKNAERESADVFASWATVHDTRELAVHVPHRRREPRVGEAAQEARRRVLRRGRAQRLDEQHLHEARQRGIAT